MAAQAVDVLPVFELDGDPYVSIYEDAVSISGGGTTARVSVFQSDDYTTFDNRDISIYTGGLSKDNYDVPNWKSSSGNLQAKNDLVNSFLAAYTYKGSATGVHQQDDAVFYMGATIAPGTGQAALSFWLFQDPAISPVPNSNWTGAHVVGDVLIQADIDADHNVIVSAYLWDTTAPDNLRLIASGVNCAGDPTDAICGVANTNPLTTPAGWDYPSTTLTEGKYIEVGVNLSAVLRNQGIPIGCYANAGFSTRSSQSKTATLSDYSLSAFESCGLAIVKDGDELSKVGDTMTYDFKVINTGVIPLELVSLGDTVIDTVFPGATLAAAVAAGCRTVPGDSACYFSVDYIVQAGDPDPLVNTVTLTYASPSGRDSLTVTDTHETNLFQPSVTVEKTASVTEIVEGETATYSYTVTNTSSADSPDLLIDIDPAIRFLDDVIGDLAALPGYNPDCDRLAPGAVCAFTIDYSVPEGTASPLVNQVDVLYRPADATFTIDYDDPSNADGDTFTRTVSFPNLITASDSYSMTVIPALPGFSIVKTATSPVYFAEGQLIGYSYEITNSGNSTITGLEITDDRIATIDCGGVTELSPGDTLTCVAAYVITADDLLVPSVTNTATVTGTPNAGTLDPVTTTETIESRLTDLRITKTDSASTYTPGTPTTYIITVTNAGVVDVAGALVEDTLPAGVTLDGSWSCTVTGGTASCISGQPAGTSASGTGDISQLVDLSAGGELQFSVPVVYSEDPLAY